MISCKKLPQARGRYCSYDPRKNKEYDTFFLPFKDKLDQKKQPLYPKRKSRKKQKRGGRKKTGKRQHVPSSLCPDGFFSAKNTTGISFFDYCLSVCNFNYLNKLKETFPASFNTCINQKNSSDMYPLFFALHFGIKIKDNQDNVLNTISFLIKAGADLHQKQDFLFRKGLITRQEGVSFANRLTYELRNLDAYAELIDTVVDALCKNQNPLETIDFWALCSGCTKNKEATIKKLLQKYRPNKKTFITECQTHLQGSSIKDIVLWKRCLTEYGCIDVEALEGCIKTVSFSTQEFFDDTCRKFNCDPNRINPQFQFVRTPGSVTLPQEHVNIFQAFIRLSVASSLINIHNERLDLVNLYNQDKNECVRRIAQFVPDFRAEEFDIKDSTGKSLYDYAQAFPDSLPNFEQQLLTLHLRCNIQSALKSRSTKFSERALMSCFFFFLNNVPNQIKIGGDGTLKLFMTDALEDSTSLPLEDWEHVLGQSLCYINYERHKDIIFKQCWDSLKHLTGMLETSHYVEIMSRCFPDHPDQSAANSTITKLYETCKTNLPLYKKGH